MTRADKSLPWAINRIKEQQQRRTLRPPSLCLFLVPPRAHLPFPNAVILKTFRTTGPIDLGNNKEPNKGPGWGSSVALERWKWISLGAQGFPDLQSHSSLAPGQGILPWTSISGRWEHCVHGWKEAMCLHRCFQLLAAPSSCKLAAPPSLVPRATCILH